jgi:predicted ATPase
MNLRYAKLTNIPSLLEEENEEKKLIDEISSIIGGTLEYSDTHEDFIYTKNINENNYSFRSINIATGIKSLGIIQLLLKSGLLNNRTILIIDEPEVHLHPEWQLKYAEIIVKLVKYGVPVIISSHSPYMIQALRYYAMKEEIDDITKFYLAEKDNDGLVKIKDVTDDLNQIFQKLAKPLGKVM